MPIFTRKFGSADGFYGDEVLVQQCLTGNEKAWSILLDKYANLIFSIPLKRGFSREDASDIFQSVCLTLLRELSNLRQPRALAAWLVRLTAHTCTRWKDHERKYSSAELDEHGAEAQESELPDEIMKQLEREQMLREAVEKLSPECRKLVELLILSDPPVRYEAAATSLGMAKGSVGATRMRCLEKLRRSLDEKGFR